MEFRPATAADLDGIAVARLSNGAAHHDSGTNPDYCNFLIACGHLWVAVDEGRVVGFGGAIDVGGARLLSDLYVHREAHGRGVGTALLRAVLDGAASTFTFASSEPAAQAIYAREGMAATWSLATMHGRVADLPSTALVGHDIDVAEAVRHERQHRGIDHGDALRYWASRDDTRVLGLQHGDEPRGIAVVHVVDGVTHVEHLVAAEQCAVDAFTAAGLATGATVVEAYVPEVRALFGALSAAGFVVTDRSMFMTSRADVVDDDLQVLHPGLC